MTSYSKDMSPKDEKLEELENAWAEYVDWRVDSAVGGITRSFSLRRLQNARIALHDDIERLRTDSLLMADWILGEAFSTDAANGVLRAARRVSQQGSEKT